MPRNTIVLNNPVFKVADTEAGLAAGTAFECQLTSATITPVPVFNTTPSTGCAGASQSPGRTGWQLDLNWLQDWGKTPSMSYYAYDNDGAVKWYSLALDSIGLPAQVATGQAYVGTGAYGGTFGDGSTAAATATWPCLDKPDIPAPAAVLATDPELEPV